jgi:hypothetical protein
VTDYTEKAKDVILGRTKESKELVGYEIKSGVEDFLEREGDEDLGHRYLIMQEQIPQTFFAFTCLSLAGLKRMLEREAFGEWMTTHVIDLENMVRFKWKASVTITRGSFLVIG